MICKEFSGGFVGFGLDNRICRDFVFGVRNTLGVYALGLAKRGAKVDDRRFIVLRPFHPSLHACLLPLFLLFVIGRLPLCRVLQRSQDISPRISSSVFSFYKINAGGLAARR